MLLLTAGLLLLLPVLAAMQYRWLGQLSEREQERMQATLQASVERFSEDVDALFQEIHLAFFQREPDVSALSAPQALQHYERWRSVTEHPALLDAIWWLDVSTTPATARRLDTLAQAWQPAAASALPDGWQTISSSPTLLDVKPHIHLGETPFLAVSYHTHPASDRFPLRPAPPDAFVLLALNGDYLRDEVLPALTETYFSEGNRLIYDVLITTAHDASDVFYESAPSLQYTDFATPDATAPLGHLRLTNLLINLSRSTRLTDGDTLRTLETDHLTAQWLQQGRDTSGLRIGVFGEKGQTTQVRFPGGDTTVQRFMRRTTPDSLTVMGERMLLQDIETTPQRIQVQVMDTSRLASSFTLLTEGGSGEVRVKHRAGSLEAAVQNARWRNLLLSSGILLLLGVSMVLIVRSAQQAKTTAQQQMEFVAGVTHELRTPLAVIRSAGENLADGMIHQPEQVARYGNVILGEGRRLSDMVEQTLLYAGLEANHTPYALQPVALRTVIQQAVAQYEQQVEAHPSPPALHLDMPDALPTVQANAPALAAALRNLLGNAAKYGGNTIHLGVDVTPRDIQLTVTDNGPGIPADEQRRIFEPFFRGRAARNAQTQGSGLGLHLVQRIIAAHGGRVTLDSADGGSTFTIHLPIQPPSAT